MNLTKRVAAAAVAAAATIGGAAVAATGEVSAAGSYCNSSTCSLATKPYTKYITFEMPRLTPVKMICWTSTQSYMGTAKWFKVSTTAYGTGYMSANQVSAQTIVPGC